MFKHVLQLGHPSVSLHNFRILRKRHNNNKIKIKISESLLITKYQPSLNMHKNLVPLELFH